MVAQHRWLFQEDEVSQCLEAPLLFYCLDFLDLCLLFFDPEQSCGLDSGLEHFEVTILARVCHFIFQDFDQFVENDGKKRSDEKTDLLNPVMDIEAV